ncbi:MAG: pirin family protein [Planctomycetota bacterium]
MIRIRRSQQRGHADLGWLDTRYTFSFADYHDPDHVQFGPLRVINQDRIAPGAGFPTHGHRDMEIVTYVLEGAVAHKDSMGNGSEIRAGEVQIMSAGRGVTHSEFNASETEPLHLLQMWVFPRKKSTEPRYGQKQFSDELSGKLRVVVSGDGRDGSLQIDQDVRLFASRLEPGQQVAHDLEDGRLAWLHVATGAVTLNGEELREGDGAAIEDESRLEIEGREGADLVLWDLPTLE